MNFADLGPFRSMRVRLQTAIKRGRIAVLDIGSSKITCLVLKLDPGRLAEAGEHDRLGTSLFGAVEVVGARTVQSRGVRRGEIIDMDEVCRCIRLALLNAEKMAAPRVDRVDQVIVSFSGGRPVLDRGSRRKPARSPSATSRTRSAPAPSRPSARAARSCTPSRSRSPWTSTPASPTRAA